jgi:cellulose synthase/poly-beta-1,6-N-acetylglucosamine synthase-like glycosyltransferase
LSKYNLNHLNILIAVLWLCCANIVVVDDFSLESDDSLSSLSDSSGDDEDRVRPKNENYFEETIPQYNEQEFMEHFRVSRQVANSIAERFEMSDYFKPQSGCYGKLSTSTNSNFFMVCRASDCKF